MATIGILVNSAELYSAALDVIEDAEKSSKVVLAHTYEESLRCANEMLRQGCRVLIARGGHSAYLRAYGVEAPIMDIPFDGNDIALQLYRAGQEHNRFGVVGSAPLIQTSHELSEILNKDIVYFPVKEWDDFEKQIIRARACGLQAIVGGYDACGFANAAGLKGYCIKGSRSQIMTALQEAKKMAELIDREAMWSQTVQVLIASSRDAVILLDHRGIIRQANAHAKQLFWGIGELTCGSRMPLYAMQKQILRALANEDNEQTHQGKRGSFRLRAHAIYVDGYVTGVIASLYTDYTDVDYIKAHSLDSKTTAGQLQSAAPMLSLQGDRLLAQTEHAVILQALESTGGNKSEAARRLGISRPTLNKKIQQIQSESTP